MLYLGSGDDNPYIQRLREAEAQRQEAARRSIDVGGLPPDIENRLQGQAARQGTGQHCFTSNLSVNEFALTRQAGYEPLGQVIGSAVWYVAPEWYPQDTHDSGFAFALERFPDAFNEARQTSLKRLRQEARLLGATGVVGIRLRAELCVWHEGELKGERLEFAIIGTAIRELGSSTLPARNRADLPFLSNLSGEDFWKLREAGYRPLDVVCGYAAYAHLTSREMERRLLARNNQEVGEYTRALYKARKLAMTQLEDEASAVGACGVVGTVVKIRSWMRGDPTVGQVTMVFYFSAIGTAIVPIETASQVRVAPARPTKLVPIISLKG